MEGRRWEGGREAAGKEVIGRFWILLAKKTKIIWMRVSAFQYCDMVGNMFRYDVFVIRFEIFEYRTGLVLFLINFKRIFVLLQ